MSISSKLAEALRELIDECETNIYFATEHRSEMEALCAASNALSSYDRMRASIQQRRSLDELGPEGYLESDRDFVLNNLDACIEFLED